LLIAQITDTHIRANGARAFGAQVDTSARLARAVHFLQQLDPRPDVILATGDLVDTGHPDDYAHLVSLLAPLDAPIFPIPGNHDARGSLRDSFAEARRRAPGKHIQYVIDDHPVRLIALDTLDDGRIGGRLCGERLAWIEGALAQSDRPTILFMHHPPYDYGAQPNDDMHCAGADTLARLVAAHGNVVAVLCGHLHRWTVTRWAGTVACTAPATAPVLQLNLHGRSPDGWVESPPMIGLHLWREAAGLVSHAIDVDEPAHLQRLSAPS
jgi:3',5'-cyclic AMP phosphodiesterase CpdA